jgi:hypothetical protein
MLDMGSATVVPCNDPVALRTAVLHLLERPGEAARLGARGREGILQDCTLARWLSRISDGCTELGRSRQRNPQADDRRLGR